MALASTGWGCLVVFWRWCTGSAKYLVVRLDNIHAHIGHKFSLYVCEMIQGCRGMCGLHQTQLVNQVTLVKLAAIIWLTF